MKKQKLLKIISVFSVLFLILCCILYISGLNYTAHSRYETLQGKAKTVYFAVQSWQKDGNVLSSSSGKIKNAPFSSYFTDDNYYAVVCDAKGNLLYTLYSYQKIKNFNQPDRETEYQKLKNPFQKNQAVCSYPPA